MKSRQWALLLKRMFSCTSTTLSHPERDTRVRGYRGIRLKDKAYKMMHGEIPEGLEVLDDKISKDTSEASDENSLETQIQAVLEDKK